MKIGGTNVIFRKPRSTHAVKSMLAASTFDKNPQLLVTPPMIDGGAHSAPSVSQIEFIFIMPADKTSANPQVRDKAFD